MTGRLTASARVHSAAPAASGAEREEVGRTLGGVVRARVQVSARG